MILKQLAIFFLVFLNTVYAFPKKGARGGGGGSSGKGGSGKVGGGSGATVGSSRTLLNDNATAAALLNGTATAGGSSGGIDPVLIECYLLYHNNARKEVGVPPLTWDPKLAESATAYSTELYNRNPRDIVLVHSNSGPGENLYAGYKTSNGDLFGDATCEKGMNDWLDEKSLYKSGSDFQTGTGYEHYTQMVNRGVTKVGCGVDTVKGIYLTCHYDKLQSGGEPAF